MAKGRKHGLLHQDRLLGSFSYSSSHSAADADLPDLGEDDVWSIVAAADGEASREEGWYGDPAWRPSRGGGEAGGGVESRSHNRRSVGGLSLAFDGAGGATAPRVVHQYRNADNSSSWGGGGRGHHAASSAPVNVPVWPSASRADPADFPAGHAEECGSGEWVPPHEFLAREYGGRTAAGSVFEGVGRTLKGRDLRRLRDAVWSQTGFYG